MGDITIKSLFREDLQRFKMARDDGTCTLGGVRAKLEAQHRGMLPPDFVIKYEWGKGLQELTTDAQLEAVIKTLAEAGNSPLRLYLSAPEPSEVESAPAPKPAAAAPRLSQSTAKGAASPRTPADLRPTPRPSGVSPLVATSSASAPFESKPPATPTGGLTETELVYKIMVVGNAACGKTSIIKRFVDNVFSETYKSTVGADFSRKIIQWDEVTTIRLQLWDIAGQDRFAAVTRAFYKNAVGAVVVCDVTRQSTLEAVAQWKSEIDSKVVFKGGQPVPAVLLVNKVDLLTDAEESFRIGASFEKMATECGFNSWYITSAKTDHNITEGMHFLIQEILAVGEEAQNALTASDDLRKTVAINGSQEEYEEEASCC